MNRTASIILGLTLSACSQKAPASPASTENQVETAPTATVTPAPAPVEAASAPVETAAAAPAAPPLGIAPFSLTIDEIGKPANKVTVELAADGTVKASNKAKEKDKMLKFVGNELRDDTDWIARVLADGTVEMKSTHVSKRNGKVEKEETKISPIGKFGANDELTIDKGGSMRVADDGTIVLTGVDPKVDPMKGVKMRFNGVTAQSRRAATILFVSIFAGSRSESDMSDATSAPATPPGTKAAATP